MKEEPTPYRKTRNADGSPNPLARYRIIKVQSLEDEILCRILVTPQVDLEKRSVSIIAETVRCPVLVGSGLDAGGRDILCRHMEEMARVGPQAAPDKIRASAVGDDSMASPPLVDPPPYGCVTTWDGQAFDETADTHRYCLLGLALAMGYLRCGDSLGAASTLAFHLALANQPAEVGGVVFTRPAPWPSAVSHTSAGDAIPAAAYSRLLVRNASFANDANFLEPTAALLEVGVRLKGGYSVSKLADGVDLLSCTWRREPDCPHMTRTFNNIGMALVGSTRVWHLDRAIAVDTLLFDSVAGRDQPERALWREFVRAVDVRTHREFYKQVVEADADRRKAALAVFEY